MNRRTWLLRAISPLVASVLGSTRPRDPTRKFPEPTYTNPILAQDFPDPFVLRHEGVFHAYATQRGNRNLQHATSEDLIHWKPGEVVVENVFSRRHLWAPEVVRLGDRFVMTYSALDPLSRKHHIAVATSDAPEGPFLHRDILVRGDDNQVGVIDATIFLDGPTPYLIYSEETPRRIVLRRLQPDGLAVLPDPPVRILRPDQAWEQGVTEAPTLLKRENQYVLIYSGGHYQGTRESCRYAVGFALADEITGPYRKAAEPFLQSVPDRVIGPGHQCLVTTPNGDTWLLYHAWDSEKEPRYGSNPLGRTLRLDRLTWDGPRPQPLIPSTEPMPAPVLN
jgi:beta-xylosidase